MQGLLADVNVQGHLRHIHQLLVVHDLWTVLVELKVRFVTFSDIQLPLDLDDRFLWKHCQDEGWVLFTENRNHDSPDSLQATLNDSWRSGNLPVLTLANKERFERDPDYAARVAEDVAELLFGITEESYRDQPRIYIPL